MKGVDEKEMNHLETLTRGPGNKVILPSQDEDSLLMFVSMYVTLVHSGTTRPPETKICRENY